MSAPRGNAGRGRPSPTARATGASSVADADVTPSNPELDEHQSLKFFQEVGNAASLKVIRKWKRSWGVYVGGRAPHSPKKQVRGGRGGRGAAPSPASRPAPRDAGRERRLEPPIDAAGTSNHRETARADYRMACGVQDAGSVEAPLAPKAPSSSSTIRRNPSLSR